MGFKYNSSPIDKTGTFKLYYEFESKTDLIELQLIKFIELIN